MTTVAVTVDNDRVDDAENATGYSNIGGGASGASEAPFAYQGNNLFNRKVTSSSGAGFYYNPASDGGLARNLTGASKRTVLVKAIVSDFGGLQTTNGFRFQIGSGTTAYHEYIIAGSLAKIASLQQYPSKGGLIIIPIDPNISAYRESTSGSPALTACDYFGLVAAFASASAKSENVGLDALDLADALILTGGDGVDPDGEWQDFVDADEGTVNNRYGLASSTFNAVKLFYGTMQIGNASATVFTDVTSQILWLNGLFGAGWSRALIDLQNAATIVEDGAVHTGLGDTNLEDTRPDYTVTGTAGAFTFKGQLNNFRNVNISKGDIVDAVIEALQIELNGVTTITNTTVVAGTRVSGNVSIFSNDADIANMQNVRFVKDNAETVRSAISITTPGTYTFDALFFDGWGADGQNSAAILNDSGGLVTINIVNGGDTPTVRNTSGASTVVNNPKTLTITNIPLGLEARVRKGAFNVLYENNIVDGDFVYSYNFTSQRPITLSIGGVADDGTAYERREIQLFEENFNQSIRFDQFINPSYTTN